MCTSGLVRAVPEKRIFLFTSVVGVSSILLVMYVVFKGCLLGLPEIVVSLLDPNNKTIHY